MSSIQTSISLWRSELADEELEEQRRNDWIILCARLDLIALAVWSLINIALTIWFLSPSK